MRTPSRLSLALRGIAALLVIAVVSGLALIQGTGSLVPSPTVSAVVPAAAGPVRTQSPVQYRGVVVGELTKVEAGTESARLTLRMDPGQMRGIPGDVRVRILPRTLFGDQYVDLASARTGGSGRLRDGAMVAADRDAGTAQLYVAMTRLHELLSALDPAEFQATLSTVANTLRGRGDDIGRTIDQLHELSGRFTPEEAGENLAALADTGQQLARSSPDLFAALDGAVVMSRMVSDKRQQIGALLAAGTGLATEAKHMLGDNADRAIRLLRLTDPIGDVLGANSGQVAATWDSLDRFLDAGNRVFRNGKFQIRAPLTLEDPFPYTAEDCPSYPGLPGPHCAEATGGTAAPVGGTVGPVGSPQEQNTMRRLAGPREVEPDVMSVLFGPIVRGTEVVVP